MRQIADLGDVKPVVVIGGKDESKFVPNLNMSFFDDEFFININRKNKVIKNQTAATASGKTSLGGDDTDIWYIDDTGRLKWDIEFASRPAVNSWTWELKHTKGIDFFYQGELTPEEIADGCERPEEVVGSYAVYCNKSNNKYKTGKLCHIYRPFCYDAKGNTIYADLKIAGGQLTITIDPKWLDSAVYPVCLDPPIGYITAGASSDTDIRTLKSIAYNITMSENGTASKIYASMRGNGSAHDTLFGYYDDNSGVPNNLIDGNKSVSITSATQAWYSADVTGSLTSGSKYYPTIMTNPGFTKFNYYYYDSGTSGSGRYRASAGSTMPSSYGSSTSSTQKKSIYLEYTTVTTDGGCLVGASALVGGGVLCGQGNLIN